MRFVFEALAAVDPNAFHGIKPFVAPFNLLPSLKTLGVAILGCRVNRFARETTIACEVFVRAGLGAGSPAIFVRHQAV